MPRVSVIIPACCQPNYLAETIQSVLDQTFPDFELLIFTDPTPNGSSGIINQFDDSRIKYIVDQNNHRSTGPNSFIQAAAGESTSAPILDTQTLEGTTWGREGFELEFAPGGELRIGGRERARWQVLGNRIRLYDQRGEEHWLEIAGGRITWNGEEVGRIR